MATNYEQFDGVERTMKKNEKAKSACGAFLVGALTASLITWGIIELSTKDSSSSSTTCTNNSYLTQPVPTPEQAAALSDIRDVFANSTWTSSLMGDDDKSTVQDAYDTFDEDADGIWSYDEFITYKSLLANHTSFFDTIDVDNDTIVSIRELVAYFRNIGGVGKYIFNKNFENRVLNGYGLDERNITSKSQLFHEYAVDILFQNFDGYGKGYFNLTDFQYIFYNRSFIYFDRDDDNMVSFEEFLESQYHQNNIDSPSDTFNLFRNADTTNLYTSNDYDHTDAAALNLSVCPVTEYNGNTAINYAVVSGGRRRLSCLWDTLDCTLDGVESAASCSTAFAADGAVIPDDLECGGKLIELGSSCYEAWEECFR